jgi:CYTH domain-containing protein
MLEIERKFLVKTLPRNLGALPHVVIHQGYLAFEPGDRHVRIRRIGDEHWLTTKVRRGAGREEVTVALTADDFAALWPLTEGRRVQKTRYFVPHGDLTVEIDLFCGRQDGIVMAEVEFADEERCLNFVPPEWLGEEVTSNPAYKNTTLAFVEPVLKQAFSAALPHGREGCRKSRQTPRITSRRRADE